MTSLEPVFTTTGVNGVGRTLGFMKASRIANATAFHPMLRTNFVVDLAHPHAVMHGGEFERPDLVAIVGGGLLADWRWPARAGRAGACGRECSAADQAARG